MRVAELVGRVREGCRAAGLDLVHPFRVDWYNDRVTGERHRLPDAGRRDALGLVIGNTRALWPAFRARWARDASLREQRDPLDRYVTDAVEAVRTQAGVPSWVRYGHELEPYPLPIQRIAHAAGLAQLAPSHLSVHPQHGPWIALRAVLVFAVQGPPGPAAAAPDPCAGCARPCVAALEAAVAASATAGKPPPADFWELWLAVRDACPVGSGWRYDADQLEYHYTKARRLLDGR